MHVLRSSHCPSKKSRLLTVLSGAFPGLSNLAAEHCQPAAQLLLLMLAGEVLQGERDALLKLIQSMRDEYEATLRNKEEQEAELRGLKVKPWRLATMAV